MPIKPLACGSTVPSTQWNGAAAARRSLGACTAITVRMYADRKGWPLRQTTVRLRHRRIHASDCADCETRTGQLDRIDRELQFEGELTEEQRARLLDIAERCPVHRTLHFRGARHNGREHSGSAWRLKRSN
jgi:hypothetical protein